MSERKWTFEDLPQIEALERECFPDPWSHMALTESLLSPTFYGVLSEEGDCITAYGGMNVVCDEGEILLIATAEMFRRCGRGQRILDLLTEEAKRRGAKKLFLEVRVSNAEAQMLYLKNGFQGIYVRPRYYQDGEDAVVMKKELA